MIVGMLVLGWCLGALSWAIVQHYRDREAEELTYMAQRAAAPRRPERRDVTIIGRSTNPE